MNFDATKLKLGKWKKLKSLLYILNLKYKLFVILFYSENHFLLIYLQLSSYSQCKVVKKMFIIFYF